MQTVAHPDTDLIKTSALNAARQILSPDLLGHVDDVVNATLQKFNASLTANGPSAPKKARQWAFSVARNHALAVRKSENRFQSLELGWQDRNLAYSVVPDFEMPDKIYCLKQLLAAIEKATSVLSQTDQEIFDLLRKVEQPYCSDEVRALARRLGLQPDSLIHRWSRLMIRIAESVTLDLKRDRRCREMIPALFEGEQARSSLLVSFFKLLPHFGVEVVKNVLSS